MGSGESDVRSLTVNTDTVGVSQTTWPLTSSWPLTTYYGQVIYKYQIKCPVKTCKTMNWLELDKITPCINCQTRLKAVSEQADFEVPVIK